MTDTADFLRLREQAAAPGLDPGRPCWIFGAGSFGRSLASAMQAQGIAVAGFVETAPRTDAALGLPVLDRPSWPWASSTATRPMTNYWPCPQPRGSPRR
jgi:hypothetical protein